MAQSKTEGAIVVGGGVWGYTGANPKKSDVPHSLHPHGIERVDCVVGVVGAVFAGSTFSGCR